MCCILHGFVLCGPFFCSIHTSNSLSSILKNIFEVDYFLFFAKNMQLKQPRIEVPSTSMAAHVADEDVDIELYNGNDINETANTENENGVAYKVKAAPLILPPALIPRSNYSQVSSSWVPILHP